MPMFSSFTHKAGVTDATLTSGSVTGATLAVGSPKIVNKMSTTEFKTAMKDMSTDYLQQLLFDKDLSKQRKNELKAEIASRNKI